MLIGADTEELAQLADDVQPLVRQVGQDLDLAGLVLADTEQFAQLADDVQPLVRLVGQASAESTTLALVQSTTGTAANSPSVPEPRPAVKSEAICYARMDSVGCWVIPVTLSVCSVLLCSFRIVSNKYEFSGDPFDVCYRHWQHCVVVLSNASENDQQGDRQILGRTNFEQVLL